MAKERLIRDWTTSEKVNTLSVYAERFFTRLIMKVDDYGCYVRHSKLLRSALFPLLDDQVTNTDIEGWLQECNQKGIIKFYEVDGKGYLQIIDFGQRLRNKRNAHPLPPDAGIDPKLNTVGYVYLIGTDYDNPVKVGFSLNPWARLKEMSIGSPVELSILLTFAAEKRIEGGLHKVLLKFRTKNEWFRLPKDVVDLLIEYSKDNTIDLFSKLREIPSLLRSCYEVEEEVEEEEKEKEVAARLDKKIPKEVSETVNELCDYFKVTKDVLSHKYNLVTDFVETLFHRNEFEILTRRFVKYASYKARSQEAKHNIKSWIGTKQHKFRDGEWFTTDWIAKDDNYKQPNGTSTKGTSGKIEPHTGKDYKSDGGF